MTAETSSPAPAKPVPLLVGVTITALAGAALTGWGIYDMITGPFGDSAALGRSEFGGVILLLMGLLPLLAGRALLRLRRWGRTPAVLTNSLFLAVAYFMWTGSGLLPALAVPVAMLGLTGVVSLLNPRVTEALYS
ncbi:hypothetical protein [Kitasatospora sp. MAP5-34]|uniref:hypothetical protein n=1 Tax=Kitasatospora sp. MAP5-34 TaxID=3035102 RepID=UPI0024731696|nr:hypothetical protein [Kitasatospora sp. MAP5-34]